MGLEVYADLWVPNMIPRCKMLPIMLNKGKFIHSILLKSAFLKYKFNNNATLSNFLYLFEEKYFSICTCEDRDR